MPSRTCRSNVLTLRQSSMKKSMNWRGNMQLSTSLSSTKYVLCTFLHCDSQYSVYLFILCHYWKTGVSKQCSIYSDYSQSVLHRGFYHLYGDSVLVHCDKCLSEELVGEGQHFWSRNGPFFLFLLFVPPSGAFQYHVHRIGKCGIFTRTLTTRLDEYMSSNSKCIPGLGGQYNKGFGTCACFILPFHLLPWPQQPCLCWTALPSIPKDPVLPLMQLLRFGSRSGCCFDFYSLFIKWIILVVIVKKVLWFLVHTICYHP